MGDDLFRLLGAGVRFDRKKNAQTMSLFQQTADNESNEKAGSSKAKTSVASLDFFRKDKEAAAPKSQRKEKRKAADEEDEHGKDHKAKKAKKAQKQKGSDDDEDEDDEDGDYNDEDEDGESAEDPQLNSDDEDDAGIDPTKVITFSTKEEANEFRKKLRIKVTGEGVPDPTPTFPTMIEKYKLRPFLAEGLKNVGFKRPTSIQMQTFPLVMEKRELFGIAPTGSGKTLAFLLPIMHHLRAPAKSGFRALIIVPTRELAQQTYREFKKLSGPKNFRACVLTKARANESSLSTKNFDLIITTPMRLVGLIQQNFVDLKNVEHLVLDEGDRLLELGFLEQVDEILSACSSPKIRHYLFSATLPANIEELAKSLMRDPVRVAVGNKNAASETIKQQLLFVGAEEGKLLAVRQLIQKGIRPPVLIFVQSIDRAKELFHELIYDGINVDVIHSERTQAQRDQIVTNFRAGKIWVLIATELMSRGMDFKGVSLVINYDFPQSVVSYIHRIGRAGRAGREGEAITFFTKEDADYLKSIANVMQASGCDVPEWMLSLKKPTKEMKKRLKMKPIERERISTMSEYDLKKNQRKRAAIEKSIQKGKGQKNRGKESQAKKAESKK